MLKDAPSTPLRGLAAGERAVCLARSAELPATSGAGRRRGGAEDRARALQPRRDPVAWALVQLHLARLYEARVEITGKDRGERASAVMALDAALDVFAEQGLRSLTVLAATPWSASAGPGQAHRG